MTLDTKPATRDAAPSSEEPCPVGPGDVLAQRYAVELMIDEGTFGWVLAAIDLAAEPPRRVAVKLLRRHYAAQDELVRRFERRELALLLRVQDMNPSAHVVRALEPTVQKHGELPFLVLEFIDGPSLREFIDGGLAPPTQVRAFGAAMSSGLAAIHGAGGVHRDLKPTNIRLRGGSEPVIVDLGITRALWETQEFTETGRAPMTPRYASPEQLVGKEAGPASDIYSLGMMLYEMLMGSAPSAGQSPREALSRQRIPRELAEWVSRCLELDPARRPTALELATALSAPPARSRRSRALPRWALRAGVVLLALLGVVDGRPTSSLPPPLPDIPAWSRRLGDAERQKYVNVALDGDGNVLIAGAYRGSVDFGNGLLTSAGSDDVFVAKLTPDGQTRWSQRFGDASWQGAQDVAADDAGNVFVAGLFSGTLYLGGQPLFTPSSEDVFLARFDSEGHPKWSQGFKTSGQRTRVTVAADPHGHAVLAGYFNGAIDFGEGALASAGQSDAFLARFALDGRLLWSQRFGDARDQRALSIAVDREGNIALTGTFVGSIDFGAGPLISTDPQDVFVAVFDPDGRLRWNQRLPGRSIQGNVPITFDAKSHVVLAGAFDSAAGLPMGPLAGNDEPSVLVTLLTADGQHLWSRRIGKAAHVSPSGIASAPGERIVVVGSLQGDGDLGDGPFSGLGGFDVFVLELSPEGALIDARRFGNAADQFAAEVAIAPGGNPIFTGMFDGTLDFGSGLLLSEGDLDLVIARLAPRLAPLPLSSQGEGGEHTGCLPPFQGLVAWYPLDEPDAGQALGVAPPGTLLGGANSEPGWIRSALSPGGGYFQVPDSAALDLGVGAFSVSAWIRTTDTTDVKVILDKRSEAPSAGPALGYALFLYRGRPGFQLATGVGTGWCQPNTYASCTNYWSTQFVADGAWHLLTVTVDRGGSDTLTFYVDGVAEDQLDTHFRQGTLDNDQPLRLGSRSSSETGLFHGLIDEVTLWNRALAPTEIASMYRAGSAGMCRFGLPQSSEPPRRP
jgi:hypothetical protein